MQHADVNVTKAKQSETLKEQRRLEDLSHTLPNKSDFDGALKGLIFLHDTYRFSLTSAANGILRTSQRQFPSHVYRGLDFEDFFLLTKQAFRFKWYDRAADFLRTALQLWSPPSNYAKASERMRKNLVLLNNQDLYASRKTVFADRKILPYIVGPNLGRRKQQPDFVVNGQVETSDPTGTRQGREQYAREVCSGRRRSQSGKKVCFSLHRGDPFLRLGPFKIEVVSSSPFIALFHDFLSESEISFLIEYSKPRLSRQRVEDSYNDAIKLGLRKGKKTTRVIHKSVQCWLKDIEYERYFDNLTEVEDNDAYTVHMENLLAVSRRIELATGLNATAKYAATEYQTTNYGLGGMCEAHFDPNGYNEGVELPPHPGFLRLRKQGDMMATVMGWLGEVGAGGATAFSQPGHEALLPATRGAVAFWFNLDRKGHRDRRLLHSGCPVLLGAKWIVNKWIYYFDQFRHFPCGLSENGYYSPLTNQI